MRIVSLFPTNLIILPRRSQIIFLKLKYFLYYPDRAVQWRCTLPIPLVQIVPLLLSGTICATNRFSRVWQKKRSSRHSHRFQLLSMCLMMFVEVHCMCNVWLTAGLDHNLLNPQSHKIYKNAKIAFIHIGQNSIMYMCIRLLWCSFIAYILICIYSVDGCFSFGLLCCWIIAPRVLCVLSCRPVKRRLIIHGTVRPIHSSSMRLNDSQFFVSITPFLPFWFDFFFCRMAALSALIIWSKSKFWGDQCLVVCFLCLSYTLQVVFFWFGSSIVLTSCTWRLCVVVETGMVWVLAREKKKHSKKSRCVVHFWVLSHL